ncbi:hypothetical protein HIR72_02560, partial [Pasteurella multocida]|uniref:hypothetical protein n=1 Tax=Pasteurella multocida TaxID=747 RepID=UPI0014614FB4
WKGLAANFPSRFFLTTPRAKKLGKTPKPQTPQKRRSFFLVSSTQGGRAPKKVFFFFGGGGKQKSGFFFFLFYVVLSHLFQQKLAVAFLGKNFFFFPGNTLICINKIYGLVKLLMFYYLVMEDNIFFEKSVRMLLYGD